MTLQPERQRMPLEDAIREVDRIQNLFICNEYLKSIAECDKQVDQHFMFRLVKAMLTSINAVVTFQEAHMEQALQSIQKAIEVVDQHRRKSSRFSRLIWTPNYDDYTDDECLAEGCYAVLTACMSGMTIISEKSFMGLIKACYWGKSSLDGLKECKVIAQRRTHYDSDLSKETFCHGVFVGLGLYNLAVSFVPKRILRIIKLFGFRGDRNLAFKYLMQVSKGNSLWAPIAAITILGHHCFAEFIVGFGNPDIELVQKILEVYRTKYPGSGFFLVYEGTIRLMQGQAGEAIEYYEKSIEKFVDWPEWQYACHWFITWCYAILCDWEKALHHTKILVDHCNWSKCVFMYQYAAFLKMIEEETSDAEKKAGLQKDIDHYLRTAPSYKRSFVGKTIYFEKFVTKRCEIYWKEVEKNSRENISNNNNNNNNEISNDDAFMLPILDLFLFWNIFYTFKAAPNAGHVFLKKVNAKLQVYSDDGNDREKHFYLVLMKGIILKNMGDHDAAIECLTNVLDNEQILKRYSHLAPLACLELGSLFKQVHDHRLAEVYLQKSMSDYSHYLNETTVHIRAHALIETMKVPDLRKLSSASLTSLASKLSFALSPCSEMKE